MLQGAKDVANAAVPVSQGHEPRVPQRSLSNWRGAWERF